ncbi:uncharacterized protein C630.12 [Andrographis paniculata]|uniref:uncharacterized protein C630.12 n=1 Tax=Andrographis paniculata TaxID=175694 RepID=UPI0021E8C0FC|nr:uncharacterized protein C630.12 [Andrographis paniculata]
MLNLAVFLSIVWALTLLYGEWFAYMVPSLWTCSWPQLPSSSMDGVNNSSNYVKIAVVADPQLMDRTSHSLAPKSFALEIAQFYSDLYMRRAFLTSVLSFKPDAVLFLGDYFDGGYVLSDEEWQESLGRLRHIFNLNTLEKTSNIKTYFLSGNHDIGYSAFYLQHPERVERHEAVFGARNFKVALGKVDFIAVDAQTLDGGSQGDLTSATWGFVKNVSEEDNKSNPRVLLTHIPLYRPDWTPCGPHRSSEIINQRVNRDSDQEVLYQNYITEHSTKALLDQIKPVLILSGHDHDQCTIPHTSKHGPVVEHTVGTVSWQQGNLYPSFMLLSASNSAPSDRSNPSEAVSTHLCFLPTQLFMYLWYLSLFAMTLIIILLWPANEVLITRKLSDAAGMVKNLYSSIRSTIKEKNDDEDCEYEEIWDADGSMHLIKKAKNVSAAILNEGAAIERGNVVMRRKQAETEASMAPDVSIQMGSVRTGRSKTKMMIWRMLKALRALLTIAAFNVPLYVLLVFKDWIDK